MKVEQWSIDKVIPYARNPRKNDKGVAKVAASLKEYGFRQPIVVDADGVVIVGHTRLKAAQQLGMDKVPVHVATGLTANQVKAYRIADNRVAEESEWDEELLSLEMSDLREVGFDLNLTGFDGDGIEKALNPEEPEIKDVEAQVDKAEELRQKWNVNAGELWQLGDHRLLCGDSTKAEDVARLMAGAKAVLIHADPPYGMGKEKDGVENDNLYAEKLDSFQMAWWQSFRTHVADNGSAYIWGNAPDLWRLWYRGGLKDSERLTMRNEIVWQKPGAFGITSDEMRGFPTQTERCIFFMLGEQSFNNNADNYWDGWEPVRSVLDADCKKMGWGPNDIKRICGVGMYSHWFTKSQWTFIPEEHYRKLQAAAREHDAFKREHDELKREHDELKRDFYATRAYFDNAHDNMTDVWEFPRVSGEERHGHATPKPVAMICRAIKSSTPPGAIVAEPFLGSGTTLISAEQLGRKCYGMEISPAYCAVILQRWADATGGTPCLVKA